MNRALDVAIAGVGLALTSPFLAAGALAVKLRTAGRPSTGRRGSARTVRTSSS